MVFRKKKTRLTSYAERILKKAGGTDVAKQALALKRGELKESQVTPEALELNRMTPYSELQKMAGKKVQGIIKGGFQKLTEELKARTKVGVETRRIGGPHFFIVYEDGTEEGREMILTEEVRRIRAKGGQVYRKIYGKLVPVS